MRRFLVIRAFGFLMVDASAVAGPSAGTVESPRSVPFGQWTFHDRPESRATALPGVPDRLPEARSVGV